MQKEARSLGKARITQERNSPNRKKAWEPLIRVKEKSESRSNFRLEGGSRRRGRKEGREDANFLGIRLDLRVYSQNLYRRN